MKKQNKRHYTVTSVETIPGFRASAVFVSASDSVFKEEGTIAPKELRKGLLYMPWGADNRMPYRILKQIEEDETVSTCQIVNAEMLFGSGLRYDTCNASRTVADEVETFTLDNSLSSYFLGVCQDFKHFGFAVTVIILSKNRKKIVRILRKEACYCRFGITKAGEMPSKIIYANWNRSVAPKDPEVIDLIDPQAPWSDLSEKVKNTKATKFAFVSRVPTVDSTYYPIPHYAALFRGKWYDIKKQIGVAKLSKLINSAPIKYQIEVSKNYWERRAKEHGVTGIKELRKFVAEEKRKIIEFLTGAENSGKVLFNEFYVDPNGKVQHDVLITKIDSDKEGGDWASDIQEAVNMICFTMRVHSNLVGSVPGKSQSNNSGSDKRELYTIGQAQQLPYRELLYEPHRIIIRFNGWKGVSPECPFIQLTTLDKHTDATERNGITDKKS